MKRLEELGIGRPSTYAPTITTIINRGYVVKQNKDGQKRDYVQFTLTGDKIAEKSLTENYGKEKNRLSPTDIGMVVNDYLENAVQARSSTTISRPTSRRSSTAWPTATSRGRR